MGSIRLSSVFLFLRFPSLHECVLAHAFHSGLLWMTVAPQSKSSTVQRLSPEGSLIETDTMVKFVNAIQCLTESRFVSCDTD